MPRFVIVGMSNPQGNEPFWPDPPGCAGHRLWQLATARTGVSQEDWLRMTDRRNLCVGEWDPVVAKAAASAMLPELRGKTTVFLGEEVAACFPSTGLLFQWQRPMGTPPRNPSPWIHIPHPSGRNLWYNNPINRVCVEILLGDLVFMCQRRAVA